MIGKGIANPLGTLLVGRIDAGAFERT